MAAPILIRLTEAEKCASKTGPPEWKYVGHDSAGPDGSATSWNVTAHPRAPWVWRQVMEATAWNRTPRFWIRDRDTSYGRDFLP